MRRLFTSWCFGVLIGLGAFQIAAIAAVDYMEYFDLQACSRGSVSNDFSIAPMGSKQYDEDIAAQKAAEKSANGRWLLESAPRCYGYCKRTISSIQCDMDSCAAFPLAGATFKLVKKNGTLPSYKCVAGCRKGVPQFIHDLGYGGDDERNLMWERLRNRMRQKCGKAFER